MGIRLVYGLKTTDLAYLSQFHPSRRLAEASRLLDIDYNATLFGADVSDGYSSGRLIDFCRSHTALLRGELPERLYRDLEAEGIRVVNSASSVGLAADKLRQVDFFRSVDVPHPLTDSVHNSVSPPFAMPFIVKPRFGRMGIGVRLIRTDADWMAFLDGCAPEPVRQDGTSSGYTEPGGSGLSARKPGPDESGWIAQEFLAASHGRDVRFFFADFKENPDDHAATVKPREPAMHGNLALHNGLARSKQPEVPEPVRHTPRYKVVMRTSDGLVSNAHVGGTMILYDPPEELCRMATRTFVASGLVYGTVDFLFRDDAGTSFAACEINSYPGFQEFERATGLDAAVAILRSATADPQGDTVHAF